MLHVVTDDNCCNSVWLLAQMWYEIGCNSLILQIPGYYFQRCCHGNGIWHPFSSLQAAGRQRSPMPSWRREWHTPWPKPAARAIWASADVTATSRASTVTGRQAGSGGAARLMSSTAWSSHGASWTPGRLRRTRGGWWICTTMKQGERYDTEGEHTPASFKEGDVLRRFLCMYKSNCW